MSTLIAPSPKYLSCPPVGQLYPQPNLVTMRRSATDNQGDGFSVTEGVFLEGSLFELLRPGQQPSDDSSLDQRERGASILTMRR
jgi:hypothetical protein